MWYRDVTSILKETEVGSVSFFIFYTVSLKRSSNCNSGVKQFRLASSVTVRQVMPKVKKVNV